MNRNLLFAKIYYLRRGYLTDGDWISPLWIPSLLAVGPEALSHPVVQAAVQGEEESFEGGLDIS